ncbi:MAG: glutamine--tRNA ligase/YqeY domain fusion protein [Proteobacteria bacterium]|nr:glutamine--tRNA ligase/YqeY domain fusion protein [Pseudomonadota bacterium]
MSINDLQASSDFIRTIVANDLASGKHDQIVTRFPPEPNGYLHIGHAKSICLNFGIAKENTGARCHLRFDDTNPTKEEQEYVESIKDNVRWLGFDWGEHLYFASDYFDQLYEYAEHLITTGKAYVCDLSAEDTRSYRGTLTEPGRNSPFRERSVEENLDLFRRMRGGEYPDGTRVLRAKIDMASGNMNMRDPVLYRILHASHHRTGDTWCIYPMYDYTHPISDALEGVTHSLCTLEFADHRPLYDWTLDNLPTPCHPRQIEFARLNLSYTVVSKRKLLQLVNERHVAGWDDPRMPTLSGIRRRGYTPAALRSFCEKIGVAKKDSVVDVALLEHCVREDLNETAVRVMGVLAPLKVVITNYPEDRTENLTAQNHPQQPEMGERQVPFSREVYIEREDFMEEPAKKFFRLAPGREVRLRYAYFIKCEKVIKDETGEIIELHCTYDPETLGGSAPDGRKVKGTIHWVSAAHGIPAEVRLYDRLFTEESPDAGGADFKAFVNPESLVVLGDCLVEASLANAEPGSRYQFERQGYFCVDTKDSKGDKPVFNRTVTLRDTWEKEKAKG